MADGVIPLVFYPAYHALVLRYSVVVIVAILAQDLKRVTRNIIYEQEKKRQTKEQQLGIECRQTMFSHHHLRIECK